MLGILTVGDIGATDISCPTYLRIRRACMQEIRFLVQGSAPEPYEVSFVKRTKNNLSAYCTCPAGENGQYCKHRFNILAGVTKGIVNLNEADVDRVTNWLPGTDVEVAIENMRMLEKEAEKIKLALATAKKEVAKTMRD